MISILLKDILQPYRVVEQEVPEIITINGVLQNFVYYLEEPKRKLIRFIIQHYLN